MVAQSTLATRIHSLHERLQPRLKERGQTFVVGKFCLAESWYLCLAHEWTGPGKGGGVNRASKTAERMITTQMKNGNNYEDEHTKKKQNKEQKKWQKRRVVIIDLNHVNCVSYRHSEHRKRGIYR